jgi:hypothetical protein
VDELSRSILPPPLALRVNLPLAAVSRLAAIAENVAPATRPGIRGQQTSLPLTSNFGETSRIAAPSEVSGRNFYSTRLRSLWRDKSHDKISCGFERIKTHDRKSCLKTNRRK